MVPHEFKRNEVRDLFRDKKVVFLGDSIIRKGLKIIMKILRVSRLP